MLNPKFVINFPTKRDWRANSRYEDIGAGLKALVSDVRRLRIQSIAVPPLGCGLGGLDWNRVRPMIESAFAELPDVHVLLYEPAGAPEARRMPVRTSRPKLTVARALFIRLMDLYASQSYRLTLLEIQKLAYFLQEAGQPLRLPVPRPVTTAPTPRTSTRCSKPWSATTPRATATARSPMSRSSFLPGAAEEARAFLEGHGDEHRRLDRVNRLIEGFETPYGLELLSSVHWLATHTEPPSEDEQDAAKALAAWNERKRRMFRAEHIPIAWNRLASENWIAASYPTPVSNSASPVAFTKWVKLEVRTEVVGTLPFLELPGGPVAHYGVSRRVASAAGSWDCPFGAARPPPDGEGRLLPPPGSQRQLARVILQSAAQVRLGPPQTRHLLGKDARLSARRSAGCSSPEWLTFDTFRQRTEGSSCKAEILKAKSRKIQSAPASGGSTRRRGRSRILWTTRSA